MWFARSLLSAYEEAWRNAGSAGRLFLFTGFFFAVRTLIFIVAFPLYISSLGYSPSQVGLLVASTTISLFLFGVPIMRMAARGLNLRLLRIGPLISAIAMIIILTAAPRGFWLAVPGCLIAGMSGNVFWVLGDPLLAASAQERYRPQIFALKFALLTIGFGLGGGFGGWIPAAAAAAGASESRSLAAALVAVLFLDLLQAALYRRIPLVTPAKLAPPPRADATPDTVERFSGAAMIAMFILLLIPEMGMATGFNAIRPFLSLYFRETFDISTGTTGTLIGLMQLMGGFFALLIPSVALRLGNVRAMALLRSAGAMAIVLVLGIQSLPIVVMLFFVHYATSDGTSATFITEAMSRLPISRRTSFAGLAAMMWSLSSSIASSASGFLQDQTGGFTAAFSLGVAGYVVSVTWLLVVYPRLPSLSVTHVAPSRDALAEGRAAGHADR